MRQRAAVPNGDFGGNAFLTSSVNIRVDQAWGLFQVVGRWLTTSTPATTIRAHETVGSPE